MLDKLRTGLHHVLSSPRGDEHRLVRTPKTLARRLNGALGSPICSADELERRRAAQARLRSLRAQPPTSTPTPREPAPVIVYFERDRDQRSLDRIEAILAGRQIAYRKLDVTGDEATLSFILREARCEQDDLPIVYVGGEPIGGLNELVAADVEGRLRAAVFGPA